MKRNLITYLSLTIIFFLSSIFTSGYISGFLMSSFLFMLLVSVTEAKDYFERKYSTLKNSFYVMVKNGLDYDEIKKRLNISEKTLNKLIDNAKKMK